MNALVIYGGDIAKKSVSKEISMLMTSFLNLTQVIGCFFTGFLLIKYGRKGLLQSGTCIGAIAHWLVSLGFYLKYNSDSDDASQILVIVGLFLFMCGYSYSLGPVIWLYIP